MKDINEIRDEILELKCKDYADWDDMCRCLQRIKILKQQLELLEDIEPNQTFIEIFNSSSMEGDFYAQRR